MDKGKIVLIDKISMKTTGYKTFGNIGQGQNSFVDFMDQLVAFTGGRFQYQFPPDSRDDW